MGMTIEQVAKRLRVSNLTIERRIRSGDLRAKKVGDDKKWIVTEESFQDYLKGIDENYKRYDI